MTDFIGWPVAFLVALLAPAVLIMNGLVQRWRSPEASPGWLSGLLALFTALAGGVLVIASAFGGIGTTFLEGLFVLGVAEVILGLALWALIERRAEGFLAARSFGVLTAALGGLTAVMVLLIPILPGQLALTLVTPTPPATSTLMTVSATPAVTHTLNPTLPFTATPTTTQTSTPRTAATPIASPTRVRYTTPTPSVTPTRFPVCGAVAEYNVNLRVQPSLDGPIMNVIPYQSVIEIAGRNSAGSWWFARFDGEWGWLDGSYLTLDTDCTQAPVLAD